MNYFILSDCDLCSSSGPWPTFAPVAALLVLSSVSQDARKRCVRNAADRQSRAFQKFSKLHINSTSLRDFFKEVAMNEHRISDNEASAEEFYGKGNKQFETQVDQLAMQDARLRDLFHRTRARYLSGALAQPSPSDTSS
jgi:hypothetical protein